MVRLLVLHAEDAWVGWVFNLNPPPMGTTAV